MNVREFQQNRAGMPAAELAEHKGKWAAFSPDGRRIVASSPDLDELTALVDAVGEDPSKTPLEFIGGEDYLIGPVETI